MNKVLTSSGRFLMSGGRWLTRDSSGPTLPPYTIRVRYPDGVTPTFRVGTGVQVSSSPNIWDFTYQDKYWGPTFYRDESLIEVISSNLTGVIDMSEMFSGCTALTSVSMSNISTVTGMLGMFRDCTSLRSVSLSDTSNVTDMMAMFMYCSSLTSIYISDTSKVVHMEEMFQGCTSLISVPLLDTSSCRRMYSMFEDCYNVESGALALYQQASTQAVVPEDHSNAFYKCGRNTASGRAELAQIPESWGGTKP